ncbi:hypothetical protein BDZ91DRAFT_849141 [Kalaharituber pfeilii]|nr:hypothetical protein BDZ91DRAFT_849141 [Kalaharituber pfeilii]
MSNLTLDWRGGSPDAYGIYPSQYITGRPFVLPLPRGNRNAIAVVRSQEIYFTSLYAILVTTTFTAWWIIIYLLIKPLVLQHLSDPELEEVFQSFKITEPLQVSILIVRHCRQVFSKRYFKRSSQNNQGSGVIAANQADNSRNGQPASVSKSSPFLTLAITIAVLILAVGVFVGGIVAGIFLPNSFVLGTAAPANPNTVYYFNSSVDRGSLSAEESGTLYYIATGAAARAVALVDSGNAKEEIMDAVNYTAINVLPPSDRHNESNYKLQYSMKVKGRDMGLQYAGDLVVTIDGICQFMYDWDILHSSNDYTNTTANVTWRLWPNDSKYVEGNHTMHEMQKIPTAAFYSPTLREGIQLRQEAAYQFVMVPEMWGVKTDVVSKDPWYFTDPKDGGHSTTVNFRRPPLQCWETQTWSYRGWNGTFVDVRENRIPQLHLSKGIMTLLEWHFDWSSSKNGMGSSLLHLLAKTLAPTCLDAVRRMENLGYLNVGVSSAQSDIERLVQATFIMTKNLFRGTLLDYGVWMESGAVTLPGNTDNVLRSEDGKSLFSADDFIVHTQQVAAFRLEAVAAIPAVLVFSWMLVCLFWWLDTDGKIADLWKMVRYSIQRLLPH